MGSRRLRTMAGGMAIALGAMMGGPLAAQDAAPQAVADWKQPEAPKNAPNVILILLDDVLQGYVISLRDAI